MKSRCIYALLAVAVGAVSCGKMSPVQGEGSRAILLSPGIASTRGALPAGTLPADCTVYLSAYYNNTTSEEGSGNYFMGEPFTKSVDTWSATPTLYWPLGGYLDFLSLASTTFDVPGHASWYGDNVTRSVAVEVPDGSCLDAEILYGRASSKGASTGSIPLSLEHSQSWVQLRLGAAREGTTRIDSICLEKVYLGGTLKVDSDVYLTCSWDFHGHLKEDYTLPQSRGLLLGTSLTTMDLLLPEQEACSMTVWFTQKDEGESSWENFSRRTSFRVEASADPWHMGTKTIYTMRVLEQVSLSATVCPFDEDSRQITIE